MEYRAAQLLPKWGNQGTVGSRYRKLYVKAAMHCMYVCM